MKWSFYIFLVTLFFCSACAKEKTRATINGTLYDAYSDSPIPNITVSILESNPISMKTDMKVVKSYLTGNDGRFHIEFRVKNNKDYKISLNSSTHKSYSMGYVFHNGEDYKYDYWLVEE
ncbi:MAG TPA: hypothetical protein VK177_06585 [Flavobacteriales bacterium]|nr:hypothetical protein [Flavobacteriales bacterium]